MSLDRDEILRRFAAWLDSVLGTEDPPQGLPAELLSSLMAEPQPVNDGRSDLYSVWAAVTALTQEVRLQGRSFKQLSESLAPISTLAPQLPQMHREAQEGALPCGPVGRRDSWRGIALSAKPARTWRRSKKATRCAWSA